MIGRVLWPGTLLGLVSLLSLARSPAAHAQLRGLAVERRGAPRLEAEPGKTATALFRLTNHSATGELVHAEVVLPQGWRLITQEEPKQLGPAEEETRLVGFSIPAGTPAGTYTVRYGVHGRISRPHVRDSVQIVVGERRGLELQLESPPRFGIAGDPYDVRFLLRNLGNVAERVRLRLSGSDDLHPETDSTLMSLAPGESRLIPVRVATRRDLATVLRHRVEVRALSIADDSVAALARSDVEILPRATEAPSFHRLPVKVRLRTADVGVGGTVPEISGSGTLFRGGATRIDFLLRGRETRPTLYGESDEYRFGLHGRNFDLRLGDQTYSLSALTEPGRYGSGTGGRATLGRISFGGHMLRDRRGSMEEQRAAFLGLDLSETAYLGVHYLRWLGHDRAHVTTGRAFFSPVRGTTVDAEYGRGLGGRSSARAVHAEGSYTRMSYTLRHVRGGDEYPGRYNGTSADEAYLSLRPFSELRLDGSLHLYENRPTLTGAGPSGTTETRSLRVRLGYAGLLSAEYAVDERAADQLFNSYDRESRAVRVTGSYGTGHAWLSPTVEISRVWDTPGERDWPFRRLTLHGGISGARGSLSSSLERVSGRSIHSTVAGEATSVSLHASTWMSRATHLRLSLYRHHGLTANFASRQGVDATVEQKLPFGHRLVARARSSTVRSPMAAGGPSFVLDYVAPLGVPVSRLRDEGRIAGRVFDVETGAGIARVPVRLGDRTMVTDDRGVWVFSGIRPGVHTLDVDRLSVGLGRVPGRALPLAVTVRGSSTERVEIGMVRGARVSGAVLLMARTVSVSTEGGAVESSGMRDVIVQLSRGGEAVRRVTDASGRFAFADLLPGRWTLTLENPQIPPHHHLERDTLILDVRAGEAHAAEIRVLPRNRPLILLAEGEIVPGASHPRVAANPASEPRPVPTKERERPALPRPAIPPPVPTITVGMSEEDVLAKFGAPATTRTVGRWTYLFYTNGCAVRCGSDDVVTLEAGRVVTAVLRTPMRRFVEAGGANERPDVRRPR
jgi:hypothetical protein